MFWLVRSRHLETTADNKAQMEHGIDGDSVFDTDFIGATVKECQDWSLEHAKGYSNIVSSIVAIADTRSAKDGTLLFCKYHVSSRGGQLVFGRFGPLPPEDDMWYEWRIKPDINDNADCMLCDLSEDGDPASTYPVYYGSQAKFTDKDGLFDVTEARRFIMSEDADVLESDICKWPEDEPSMLRDEEGNPVSSSFR